MKPSQIISRQAFSPWAVCVVSYLARGPRFRMEAKVVRDNALSIAGLLHKQVGGPRDEQLRRANCAYQLCTSRGIKPAELQSVLKLLEVNRTRLRQGELKAGLIAFSSLTKPEELPVDATPNDIAVWTIVSRVLLNLDETMTKS